LIGLLLNIFELNIARNNLSGIVPSFSSGLTNLYLNFNNFNSTIPTTFSTHTWDFLFLNSGGFYGTLPTLTINRGLNLANNRLYGEIPYMEGSCEEVDLSSNGFSTFSPNFPINMTALVTLKIDDNNLTELPREILAHNSTYSLQNTIKITNLYLRRNKIGGNFADYSISPRIRNMDFSNNIIEGNIHILIDCFFLANSCPNTTGNDGRFYYTISFNGNRIFAVTARVTILGIINSTINFNKFSQY
jgi:hypothetical protein